MTKLYSFIIVFFLVFSASMLAQNYTVSGHVEDGISGEALIGANVYVKDMARGAASDENGKYSISLPVGSYILICSYVGYEKVEKQIDVKGDVTANFSLKEHQFTLNVTVISDRAKERETPVAFTNIDKEQIGFNLGSKDIPLVLNTAPSVFATDNGGGSGDARINVRGFNQRNVGIMINGIPINDMENGWVYWSNWDGLGDATSSIQLQRGLSAVNLATPSIGGTINIITDPTQHKAGAFFKNESGTGNFSKQTFFAHTGLVDDKFAMSIGGVRKVGDGVIDRAWTDAWAYYLGMAYQVDNKNRLELYAMGAPQQHGQRRWKLNAANFSHELAKDLGYSDEILNNSLYAEKGTLYNSNWSGVSSSYTGQQWQKSYWNSSLNQRYNSSYINESVNYFHKPLVNLNWYSQLSDKFTLYSTVYYSGGQGGGSGTFGSLVYNYDLKQRVIDYDATIARNIANTDTNGASASRGILRNSVNDQWIVGAISKAYLKASDALNISFGVDVRYAEIDHYREVRDLLGGDYYSFTGNEFDSPDQYQKKLGDKIDYNNTNTVKWVGGYIQGEYTKDRFTLYATAGYSIIKYDYTDHFLKDDNGAELNLSPDALGGYQFKGGASFRATEDVQLYVNGGYISKVPVFDGVVSDVNATLIDDPKNEKFLSFELGTNASLLEKKLTLNGNLYFTDWTDRIDNIATTNSDGTDALVRLFNVNSRYMGFELEAAYQPVRFFRIDAAFSYGDWKYTDDAHGIFIQDFANNITYEQNAYIKDLKVGDAPQTQLAAAITVFPVPGLQAQLAWRYYDNYYSQFDALSRKVYYGSVEQTWQIPSYNLFELHFAYTVPAKVIGADVTLFAHVFNLFNELYVEDALDNSPYNGYYGNDTDRNGDGRVNQLDGLHKADDAEVYPGLPTTFNLGFSVAL